MNEGQIAALGMGVAALLCAGWILSLKRGDENAAAGRGILGCFAILFGAAMIAGAFFVLGSG